MKKTLKAAACLVPSLLLAVIYIGDTYPQSFVLALVFFSLLAVLVAASKTGAMDRDAREADAKEGFFASGRTAMWIRASALAGGGLLALLLADIPYQHMVLFPNRSSGLYAAVSVSGALLLILLAKPPKPAWSLIVLVLAGLSLRCAWFSQWEIDPAKRDMLPLIISAVERFLSFENPYGFHQMQAGSKIPLTYPPGLWLAHLPAHVLGLDIRSTAWLSDAVVPLCLGGAALRLRSAAFGPVMTALAVYLFLPDVHWNGIYAEPHADFAILSALLFAALAGRPLIVGALLGAALTIRPFNLILAPFLAIWLWRRFGFEKALRAMILTGSIAAAVYLPFVLADPDAFFAGTVRWLLGYGPAHRGWFVHKMSFSGYFYHKNIESWLVVGQIASLSILVGLALFKQRSTRGLIAFLALAYSLFVAFNSIVWMSFWIASGLFAVALCAAAGARSTAETARAPSAGALDRRALAVEALLAACILASLTVILSLLYRHFDESGLAATRAFIAEEVDEGDLIVDNSGYRAAFLETPYMLDKDDLPEGARLGEQLFMSSSPRRGFVEPLSPRRVIALKRYDSTEKEDAVLLGTGAGAGPYEVGFEKTLGRYTVKSYVRRKDATALKRLSAAPSELAVRAITADESMEGRLKDNKWIFAGGDSMGARMSVAACGKDKSSPKMLVLTPVAGVKYEVEAPLPAGARWVTLFGSFPDRAARWRHSPVKVIAKAIKETPLGAFAFPNLPGMSGITTLAPKRGGSVAFEIKAGEPSSRTFCFDVVFSGERKGLDE